MVRMRLARMFRWGLIKSRSAAEIAFEGLLNEMNIEFVPQAIFLNRSTFYIVDFYLKRPHDLIIEIDGSNHKQKKRNARDLEQTAFFRSVGKSCLRFSDEDVFHGLSEVRKRLQRELKIAGPESLEPAPEAS